MSSNSTIETVQKLLYSEDQLERRVGSLALFGTIHYRWNLQTDEIEWKGPIDLIIPSKNTLNNDTWLRSLSSKDFDKRLSSLHDAIVAKNKSFECKYNAIMERDENTIKSIPIHEIGEFIVEEKNGRKIPFAYGCLNIKPEIIIDENPNKKNHINKLTGLNSYNSLINRLKVNMEETRKNETFSTFMLISVNHTARVSLKHGFDSTQKIISEVGKTLSKMVRASDFIAHMDGNTYGMILYGADRWGVISASNRLVNFINDMDIEIKERVSIKPEITVGGVVYPFNEIEEIDIIRKAYEAVDDAYVSSSFTNYWKESLLKGGTTNAPRTIPKSAKVGKQRVNDK